MTYNKVSDEVLTILREIVGPENVYNDEETLEKYSHDETPYGLRLQAEVVIKPTSTSQISSVLELASRKHISVTCRGQGTGLVDGAVPLHGGILLGFERMNKIIEIDEASLVAVVEAGVVLSDLRKEVESRGLFYPADPGERTSSVGGNVSTNAGGMNCVKYGKVRDWVLGLEAVLPSGKILQLGGKTVKRSTGYELMHLIIGSEGTLAVVTKIVLKLIKLPKYFITLYIPFNTLDDAVRSVSEILRNRLTPAALELVEREVILETERHVGKKMPHNTAEAYVIARLCGDDDSTLYSEGEEISKICLKNGSLDMLVADTEESQRKIWDVRSMVYDGVVKGKDVQIVDTVVPIGDIAKFMKVLKNISTKYGVRILSLGHAGDGNIHVHPIRGQISTEEWAQTHPRIMEEIYQASISFGGTISGEHGIGYTKKKYFTSYFDNEQIKLMKGIKKVFDPENILNPGKILDEEQ